MVLPRPLTARTGRDLRQNRPKRYQLSLGSRLTPFRRHVLAKLLALQAARARSRRFLACRFAAARSSRAALLAGGAARLVPLAGVLAPATAEQRVSGQRRGGQQGEQRVHFESAAFPRPPEHSLRSGGGLSIMAPPNRVQVGVCAWRSAPASASALFCVAQAFQGLSSVFGPRRQGFAARAPLVRRACGTRCCRASDNRD
jgi:hypothetical protein